MWKLKKLTAFYVTGRLVTVFTACAAGCYYPELYAADAHLPTLFLKLINANHKQNRR
jgi:hypothetical protein